MAYSNTWNDSTPLGSAAANTIDDIFRALKLDIDQRISDLHGIADFTTDPLKSAYIRTGYGTSTKGGYVALTDDTGTLRWQAGLRATATATSYTIRDAVAASDRLAIDSAGLVTLAAGLTTAGTVAVYRATATDAVFQGTVNADIHARFYMQADGKMVWGDGTLTADTTFYRQSAGLLKTDGNLSFNTITSGTWNGSVISDTYTQAKLITAPTAGRTVTNVTTYLANNAFFNVKDFGAVGDGATNDTTAIQDAITAAALVSGCVFVPTGEYAIPTTQLVIPKGVVFVGVGAGKGATFGSRFLWGGAGFLFKLGDTAGTLSYGMALEKIGINISTTGGSGVTVYGAVDTNLRDIYIEGQSTTATGTAVQIDGANIGCFFIVMQNITANHIKKGFVHTTTGSVQPTQVQGINCTALCDDISGSIGLEIQNVAGVGCGDGVLYTGGNMESCVKGISLNGSGTTIVGMRFENSHATGTDIVFETLARCNQIIGGADIYSITNISGNKTNQVLAAPKDQSGVVSQMNMLDELTIGGNLLLSPNGSAAKYVMINDASGYTGKLIIQAGNGSNAFGGSINLYGHSHATKPGDVVACISLGSGGKFRVNSDGLDAGTDWFSASATVVTAPLSLAAKHLLTSGATPSLSNQLAGSSPAIVGGDSAFTFTFTVPGGGITIGTKIADVTFSTTYANAPIVVPQFASAQVSFTVSTTGISIFSPTIGSGLAGNSYNTNFHIIGY